MNGLRWRLIASISTCLGLTGLLSLPTAAFAKKESADKQWRVPVVMEKATVRGKVVVLETRSDERKALSDLKIQVWTRKTDEKKTEKDKLVVETKTDESGFFNLPVIDVGDYVLVVAELQLRLTVVPEAGARAGQQEPKILLLLLPKEVIRRTEGPQVSP
jgi:hypothetical protein